MSDAGSPAAGFVPFGWEHVGVLVVTAATAAVLMTQRRRLRACSALGFRRGLAVVLIGNELTAWIVSLGQGHVRLPLQLCDLALALTAWALVSLRPRVTELAYFWGLAGSLQAVITPDVRDPFPTYWWAKFFLGHCGIVLAVVYLAVSGRVRPTAWSIWRVWGWTNVYAIVAGLINWAAGTNLGYLAHKPAQPSALTWLGPWPWYIMGMELVALASFGLYNLPFALSRERQQRR